jgi:hypothetical protein
MKKYLFNLSIIILLAFSKGIAQNETIQWSVISSGGTITISQNDAIEGIAGQPIVDKTSAVNDEILTGFFANPDAQPTNVTSADEIKPVVINDYRLLQNFPNPFNPSTKISWELPAGSQATLEVYDMLGREVATLVNEFKPAGKYETEFNADALPSGVYFYQLRTGDYTSVKKMILLK